MKEFYRHINLFILYLLQFVKVRMSFKADFILGSSVSVLYHAITLFSLDVMFHGYPTLNEWKREEIFFIYALCSIPLDTFNVFFTNLYMLSRTYLVEGEFDRLLLRPINPLLQLLMERINLERISGILVGFGILFYASAKIGIVWNFTNLFFVTGSLICGVVIYAGVFTAIASIGFWTPDRTGLLPPVWNLVAFGRYPVDIYNYLVRFIVCFIIPFAFVAFYPASQILKHYEFRTMALCTPLVALFAAGVGYLVWSMGVRRYESTGH